MGKIGDLWVKLGLKKDSFEKGIKEAKRETSSFGDKMKGLGSKIGAVGALVGVVYAKCADEIAKLAVAFIKHSQRMGEQWDVAMSRLKAGWNQFINSLQSWNWDDFGKKMRAAMDAAAVAEEVNNNAAHIKNAIDLERSAIEGELESLRNLASNTNATYEERAAAAARYLDLVRPIYEKEKAMLEKVAEANMDAFIGPTGVDTTGANRDKLRFFLTNVAGNADLRSALDKSSRAMAGANVNNLSTAETNALAEFYATVSDADYKVYAKMAEQYRGMTLEALQPMIDAIKEADDAAGAYDRETRRVQMLLNRAEAHLDNSPVDTSGIGAGKDPFLAQIAEDNEVFAALQEEKRMMDDVVAGLVDDFEVLNGLNLEPMKTGIEEIAGVAEANLVKMEDEAQRAAEVMAELEEVARDRGAAFSEAIATGFSDGIQELMDGLFGLTEVNGGAILSALLTPLADMATKEGEILIAAGLGIEAIKTSLDKLQGVPAILAGTALVATAAAVKSGLSALAQRGSAAGTATASEASGYGGTVNSVEDLELTVNIEGRLSGSDIVLAAQRTQAGWNR